MYEKRGLHTYVCIVVHMQGTTLSTAKGPQLQWVTRPAENSVFSAVTIALRIRYASPASDLEVKSSFCKCLRCSIVC